MIKAKIKGHFKARYGGAFNKLAPKAQNLLIDKIASKVTNPTQVEEVLQRLEESPLSVSDMADLIQSESDRKVHEAVKRARVGGGTTNGQSELSGSIGAEKQLFSIKEQARALFMEKNVPEMYWGLAGLPETEGDLPAFVEGIAGKYIDLLQSYINNSVSGTIPPASAGSMAIGGSEHPL